GEAGKKKGITTTLPLALGKLQEQGEIRRVPTNRRLDQQRYGYGVWKENPLKGFKMTRDECFVELARRYFAWIGPATLGEFAQFAGLGVGASKKAVEGLGLMVMQDDLLLLPEQEQEFAAFKAPKEPINSLVSSLDGITLLRRNLTSLVDDADVKDPLWKSLGAQGAWGSLRDLPSHAVVDRGRIVGMWEFDPQEKRIVWGSFVKPTPALRDAVEKMEAFVREDLGDARSFSLDSAKSRVPRIVGLRKRMKL
ncbi:MAG TPA: crosslink repair DNA glycosylase YcaQ family protein, partial [Phycisphaerae bacterium]